MKRWMQKLFVATIAVLTLGLYIPQSPVDLEQESNKGEVASGSGAEDKVDVNATAVLERDSVDADHILSGMPITQTDMLAMSIKESAREQTSTKLGPKIAHRIDVDFSNDILPEIEAVLDGLVRKADTGDAKYYSITEHPAPGLGEMIFNVYDERNNEDIARFHVRRDNRPQEGYWFNFHYHLKDDRFESHHTIGEIYWDKNTPPNWMA